MKVRAVTVGLSLLQDDGGGRGAGQLTPSVKERLKRAANLGNQVKEALEQAGYEVSSLIRALHQGGKELEAKASSPLSCIEASHPHHHPITSSGADGPYVHQPFRGLAGDRQ